MKSRIFLPFAACLLINMPAQGMFSSMRTLFQSYRQQSQGLFSAKSLAALLAGLGISTTLLSQNNQVDAQDYESAIQFDREHVTGVEGYWATHQDPAQDRYRGQYPWPKSNPTPWASQGEFIARLKKIERHPAIEINQYRGLSPSRLKPNCNAGSQEYCDPNHVPPMKWTQGFGPHYVELFNVKPSREFYKYVMNHPYGEADNSNSRVDWLNYSDSELIQQKIDLQYERFEPGYTEKKKKFLEEIMSPEKLSITR